VSGVLSYLGEPGLPGAMAEVDLEVITAGLKALAGLPEVDPARIAVHCASVGTGLVLSALSETDRPPVAAAIAVAPTSVVWQSLSTGGPPPKSSSVRRAGQSLPYVPLRADKLLGQLVGHALSRFLPGPHSSALAMRSAYEAGLSDSKAVADAAIPIERFSAPLLLIAGTQDAVWPGEQMARELIKRRGERADDRLLVLPDAGHFLRPPVIPTTVNRTDGLVGGGTPEGSAQGARLAWHTTLAFLRSHLGEAG
jgi:alpha-beta hydrolase superfamily lysophospholipase